MAKSYEELKTQVRKKFNINFDHVDFNECFTNKVEGKIFLDHYTFMRGLIEGTIKPNSENHVNFINTVKLDLKPKTIYELVYMKFHKFLEVSNKLNDSRRIEDVIENSMFEITKEMEIEKSNHENKINAIRNMLNKSKKIRSDSIDNNSKRKEILDNQVDQELSNIKCSICFNYISKGRIEAMPQANTCIYCAEASYSQVYEPPAHYPQPPKDKTSCPRCKKPTWVQQNHSNQEYFLACSSFPKCRWTSPFKI